MKMILLLAGTVILLTGCYTKREVVYQPVPRTTIVAEPAGTAVRVYKPGVRYYYYPAPGMSYTPKLGEYHVR